MWLNCKIRVIRCHAPGPRNQKYLGYNMMSRTLAAFEYIPKSSALSFLAAPTK